MAGAAAIHHPLREIDSGAGDVGAIVHVLHLLDRTAVNADAQPNFGPILQRRADLQGAFERGFQVIEKDQRHTISRGQTKQFAFRLRGAETLGPAHDSGKFSNEPALLV